MIKKGSLLTYRVCERATERNIGNTDKSERHTDKPEREREREERVGRKDINLIDSRREKFLFHSQRHRAFTLGVLKLVFCGCHSPVMEHSA